MLKQLKISSLTVNICIVACSFIRNVSFLLVVSYY